MKGYANAISRKQVRFSKDGDITLERANEETGVQIYKYRICCVYTM